MVWSHVYDPLGSQFLSTLLALVPLAVLLGLLAFAGWAAHWAALAGLTAALAIAVGVVGMPGDAAAAAAVHGAAFGLFPIGWIIVAAMFLYRLCVEAGALDVMKRSVTGLSADHRLQAAGFGAPVAISAALMTGAGFPPLEAAWMVAAMAGWRGLVGTWPAVLMCGATFAGVQFAMANFVGAALVDVVGGAVSLAALAVFLRAWKPRQMWQHGSGWHEEAHARAAVSDSLGRITWAWTPWAVLSVAVFCWGLPAVKAVLEGRAAPFGVAATLPAAAVAPEFPVPRLDGRIAKVPPATREPQEIERAVYRFNWLSAAGTGILVAAAFSVPWLGISWRRAAVIWWHTLRGLDPLLTCTANSTGGVMGKMLDAQSIVVSATATGTHRQEGAILRRVFPHSLALALLMGLLVWLQSGPLAWMVPR